MAIHMVDAKVEKQQEHKACWASICMAVVGQVAPALAGKSPLDLYTQWAAARGKEAQNPADVLEEEFKIQSVPHDFARPGTSDESALSRDKMKAIVVDALSRGVPVICGLTVHDDAPLAVVQGKQISWYHAVLIYKCDTDRSVFWLRDPAPGGNNPRLADRLVTCDELASGFVYMKKSDFGPKTTALLGAGATGLLKARAYKLIVAKK